MASDFEKLLIGGLDINDAETYSLEELVFTPAKKKGEWVENPDADGELLVREPHYGNSTFEGRIRVEPAEDKDTALAALGALTDVLQECARVAGGLPCPWTPAGSTRSYTAYAYLGEMPELPITDDGDLAGWFLDSPVVRFKLTCKPLLEREERTHYVATVSSAPVQEILLEDVEGDAPALARIVLADKAGQNRRFAALGVDVVDSTEPPGCLITAPSLETATLAGEQTTRSGASDEEAVIRALAVPEITTLCSTGGIEHVGPFNPTLRVYTESEDARVRISYRNGDGALVPLRWRQPPVVGDFCEIAMGGVDLEAVSLGAQTSEIRVEVKSLGDAAPIDVDYMILNPTGRGYGQARGVVSNSYTSLIANDPFSQADGNLPGMEPLVGNKWTWGGGPAGLIAYASEGYAQDSGAHSDWLSGSHDVIEGNHLTTRATISFLLASEVFPPSERLRIGALARQTSTTDWLMAYLTLATDPDRITFAVAKMVEGVETTLRSETYRTLDWPALQAPCLISVEAQSEGQWAASLELAGGVFSPSLSGTDADLRAGGALGEGRVGIYQAWVSGIEQLIRRVHEFTATGADSTPVICHANQELELRHDGALRRDASGQYAGRPFYRGASFYIPPAGASGAITRLVGRMRRNDVLVESAPHVTDEQSMEVKVTERFLAPR